MSKLTGVDIVAWAEARAIAASDNPDAGAESCAVAGADDVTTNAKKAINRCMHSPRSF